MQETFLQQLDVKAANDRSAFRSQLELGGSVFEDQLDKIHSIHREGSVGNATSGQQSVDAEQIPLHPREQEEANWQKTRNQLEEDARKRRLVRERLAARQSQSFILDEAEEVSEGEIEDEGDGEVSDDDAMTIVTKMDDEDEDEDEDDEAASQSSFIDNRSVLSDYDGDDGTDEEGNSEDSENENENDEARSNEEKEGEEIDESEIDDIVNQAYDVAASAIRSRYRVRAQFFYDEDELEQNEVSTFNYNERFLLVGS